MKEYKEKNKEEKEKNEDNMEKKSNVFHTKKVVFFFFNYLYFLICKLINRCKYWRQIRRKIKSDKKKHVKFHRNIK